MLFLYVYLYVTIYIHLLLIHPFSQIIINLVALANNCHVFAALSYFLIWLLAPVRHIANTREYTKQTGNMYRYRSRYCGMSKLYACLAFFFSSLFFSKVRIQKETRHAQRLCVCMCLCLCASFLFAVLLQIQ